MIALSTQALVSIRLKTNCSNTSFPPMAGNRAKEVESGPAVADGAALFGHGNGRAYHGPSNDFVPLTNVYVEAASQPNTLHRR